MPFINTETIETKNLLEGAEAKLIHTDGMTVSVWKFKKGTCLPSHSHFHEQITKLISGDFEMVIDGEKKLLTASDIAVIPPNAVHSGEALSDCELLDVFHPVREDYR